MTMAEKNDFDRFIDGELDLATSFWGFLVVGGIVVGFISGFLMEAVWSGFVIIVIIYTLLAVGGTWASAEKYKIKKTQNKQSIVWGILAQIYCVISVVGLIAVIYDTFIA